MLLTNGPLHIEVANNAIASPLIYDRKAGKFNGCIFDNLRNRIDLSLRTSGIAGDLLVWNDPSQLPDEVVPLRRIPGESIYLGHLMCHYGHFITETLSTFWALRHFRPARVVFHPFVFGNVVMPFMKSFLDVFEIDPDKILILKEPCEFEQLVIPERTFHANSAVHETYHLVTDMISRFHAGGQTDRKRRIFLSRSQLPSNSRGIANATEIDHLMESVGFEIIHPQSLTTREQLSIYGNTEIMIGFAGSALHNAVFLNKQCSLIELCDRRSPLSPLTNQTLCNLSAGVRAAHVPYKPLAPIKADPTAEIVDLAYLNASLKSVLGGLGYDTTTFK